MNLLSACWIPVHNSGTHERITLRQLLCGEKTGELCLPRDDMEMAALQLLVAITQVCFAPPDKRALRGRLKEPLTFEEYRLGTDNKQDWFDLAHPQTPFMQVRGVKAKEPTPMDKLLAGVADGTNKAFVNPRGLADGLCGSCSAIALFNMASNCPSMGGGFKGSLRGSTPVTQLIQGPTLRQTLWLNVLHEERLRRIMPWYGETLNQSPNYMVPVRAGETIPVSRIGIARGVLWQPAHFELLAPIEKGSCCLCGVADRLYTGFNKEKFNYTVDGIWPHPLSARILKVVRGKAGREISLFYHRRAGVDATNPAGGDGAEPG